MACFLSVCSLQFIDSFSIYTEKYEWGLPWWLSDEESACQCRRCGFDPGVRKIPWKRKWQPTPVFLESHEQRSWWATVHGVAKSWTWPSTHICKRFAEMLNSAILLTRFFLVLENTVILKVCLINIYWIYCFKWISRNIFLEHILVLISNTVGVYRHSSTNRSSLGSSVLSV